MSRPILHSLFALSLVAGCTGNLPTNGSLPAINGEQVTSVNAAAVGGMAAGDVVKGVNAANAAASTATGDALVKRDASGNFAAGTITANLAGNASTANYARGQMGSAITSASSLAIPDDGDAHRVTGSQTISALTGNVVEGYRTRLIFSGALTLDHNSLLILRGNGDYRTSAGDEFEFRAGAGGVWTEVSRTVSHDSHVRVYVGSPTAVSPLPTPITVLFNAVDVDDQGEYNLATNVFTAKQDGVYTITAQTALDLPFGVNYCKTWVSAGLAAWGDLLYPGNAATCANHIAFSTRLAAGNTVSIAVFHSDNAAHNLIGLENSIRYNYLEITRAH